jgi:hypothetical protein
LILIVADLISANEGDRAAGMTAGKLIVSVSGAKSGIQQQTHRQNRLQKSFETERVNPPVHIDRERRSTMKISSVLLLGTAAMQHYDLMERTDRRDDTEQVGLPGDYAQLNPEDK